MRVISILLLIAAMLDAIGYDRESLGGKLPTWSEAVDFLRAEVSHLAEHPESAMNVYYNSVRLLQDFVPSRFDGNLLFFTASVDRPAEAPIVFDAWHPYVTGEIENHEVECKHAHMARPGPLAEIGAVLAGKLQTVDLGQI